MARFFISILLLSIIQVSCVHEPLEPIEQPATFHKVYKNAIDIERVDELPCELIGQPELLFYKDQKGFVHEIVQNPNNANQWAYTVWHVKMKFDQIEHSYMKLYTYDLSTNARTYIDSFDDIRLWGWGGDYIAYDDWFYTHLINPETRETLSIDGVHPNISPNGDYMLLYRFASSSRTELLRISEMKTVTKWPINTIGLYGIWKDPSHLLASQRANCFAEIDCKNGDTTTQFCNEANEFIGWPVCWYEKGKSFITRLGFKVDLEDSTSENLFYDPNCNNRTRELYFNLTNEKKLLVAVDYRDYNHEYKDALFYRRFNIMNYNGTERQRVELKFD
ncbi:MAG: hypothetical protein KDC92_13660 [Bacteroidetes bacterium]|nr:hypothetical protein [Bacteroidota bacterium]